MRDAAAAAVLFSGNWTPSQLFSPTDTGDWWDVSNSNHIWTTSAATTLAGDGSVVGRIDGLKNGNNLTQGTTSAKPVRHQSGGQWYLTFDAVNDELSANFTLAQPVTRISAILQVAWTSGACIFDGGSSGAAAQLLQASSSPNIAINASAGRPINGNLAVGSAGVVTEVLNSASSKLAVNNGAYVTGDMGTTSAPGGFTVGTTRVATSASSIQFYGGLVINRVLTDAEIAKARTYFGRLCGLSL